ncbi:MAG: class I SAM-dependent methyltransferase [Acidimicrobiia bacterium]
MEGSTPDSLLALHDAGYREVISRLGSGRVLDVGCGVGSETARLVGPGREVIGIDYHPETAILASKHYGPGGEAGTDVEFCAMDGAGLGFRNASFDWVCSSHIIEHFVGPEQHVAELARVSTEDSTTFVITPNRPADFENPFHVYLFEPDELASMLRLFFHEVVILGLEGDAELKADFAERRSSGERILKLDVLNLRKHLPRSWYVWSYERVLPVVYKLLGDKSGVGSGLDHTHFSMSEVVLPTTPVLFAIARKPRRFPER